MWVRFTPSLGGNVQLAPAHAAGECGQMIAIVRRRNFARPGTILLMLDDGMVSKTSDRTEGFMLTKTTCPRPFLSFMT